MEGLTLTRTQLAGLVEQARRDAPNETCGLIGGQNGRALKIYPLKNVDENPQVRYLADPQDLLHAIRDVEENHDWDVLAIYHSHPATPPYPSPTDIGRAFYPDAIYLLLSLRNPDIVEVRGYRIQDGTITEVTVDVEEEAANEQKGASSRGRSQAKRRPPTHRPVAPLSKGRSAKRNVRPARRRVSK